jgi:hypothetical protein
MLSVLKTLRKAPRGWGAICKGFKGNKKNNQEGKNTSIFF